MTHIPASQAPIKSSTKMGGLIGRGIAHSLSPFIHNTSAAMLGLDVVYRTFDLPDAPGPEFFATHLEGECYGFNVTVPYKEQVAALFPDSKLRSVNTLVNAKTSWEAFSTDGEGFLLGLEDLGHVLSDFEAVIFLGYGGAAKALNAHFSEKNPKMPRFALKRGELMEGPVMIKPFAPQTLRDLIFEHPRALVIQATSAPLRGDDLSRFSESIKGLKGAFVDLVYGQPSAMLSYAQQCQIKAQDGLPMLLAQALLSQKLWWGQAADFSAMKAALRSHLA